MVKVDPNDYFRKYSNIAITKLSDEFDRIRKEFIKRAYDDIQEITSEGLKTQANFMFDFVENNLETVLKSAFKRAIADAGETIITEVNRTVHKLEEMDTPLKANSITNEYEFAVDEMKFEVRLDHIAEEFKYELRNFLTRKFGYMNSRDIEDAIDEIGYNVYKYLERKFEAMQEEIRAVSSQVKDDLYTPSSMYLLEVMQKENIRDYEELPGQFIFRYDGHEVVYRYEGNDFNCYKDGQKMNNSSAMEIVNREIQERFPQAQAATDSMLRRIAEIKMDSQINPDDPFGPLLDRNGNPILDMPAEKKQDVPETEAISQEEINAMLGDEVQYVNPNASYDPNPGALTQEELEALLSPLELEDEKKVETKNDKVDIKKMIADLEIKDEPDEPAIVDTPTRPIKDGDIGEIQRRMDELMNHPAVVEFLELQDMMKRYYEEYTEAISQTPTNQEVLPDVILK